MFNHYGKKVLRRSRDPMAKDTVLIVDDDKNVLQTLSDILSHSGFAVQIARNGTPALEVAKEVNCSVAIVDLNMPGMSGMETIKRLKGIDPDMEVIILTGSPSLKSSIDALREHVFDYLCKPLQDIDLLDRTVNRAVERRRLIRSNRKLMRQLEEERNRLKKEGSAAKRVIERRLEESHLLVGKSEEIKKIRRSVAQVAPSDMTVFLLGESGVGKDVVARLIHETSGRDSNAFVKINCPSIPDALLESELFGHEPGAFTGAERRKPGRFEMASGGTIFLDEIGDLPLNLQSKLLQVIEQKHFTRLGGNEMIEVDVRIIAATNAPIEKMVAKKKFRVDVFYRLSEYVIQIPPLRRRVEDIPLLVQHFLKLYGTRHGHPGLHIEPETMSLLMQNSWPGNVRELESAVRRIALEGSENSILESLRTSVFKTASSPVADVVRNSETEAILNALAETRWNRRKAAKLLGMSYSSLRRRIAKYGLKAQ